MNYAAAAIENQLRRAETVLDFQITFMPSAGYFYIELETIENDNETSKFFEAHGTKKYIADLLGELYARGVLEEGTFKRFIEDMDVLEKGRKA